MAGGAPLFFWAFYAFMLFLAAGRLKRGVISLARSPNKVRAVQFRLTWMRHQKRRRKRISGQQASAQLGQMPGHIVVGRGYK